MISQNAIKILEKRYLLKDVEGCLNENVDGMFRRVVRHVANADKDLVTPEQLVEIENDFYEMMSNLEFLPNSPTLMNAGKPDGQLSACFVLPVDDSMEGIFDTIKHTALIHKSGGGTGFSFSRLRPKGSKVGSTGGISSGPVSFMKVFNAATEAVKQGGARRGANMGLLRVDHPDILEFINCKGNNSELTNFNISIGITAAFMNALAKNENYALIDPNSQKGVGFLSAISVYNLIVEQAWKNGEPGIIFIDRVNDFNPTPQLGAIESTNPCGEVPLLPYEACNLGSVNLAVMVDGGSINYEKLGKVVSSAVHFLDNVIDVNCYPLPEIEKMVKQTRKIGLGVMGWADCLIQLGIKYDSIEAIETAESVMNFIQVTAHTTSHYLASIKGVYPACADGSYIRRNATLTTIAPTGTLSLIAGVSSGIEPLFALDFNRNQADMVLKQESKYKDVDPKYLVTAHDIKPRWHVEMQAAFQKYTDNAVSKTINLKHDATQDYVSNAFIHAYKSGCKGITVYRDGSRENQTLQISDNQDPRKRPEILHGFTRKVKVGCGSVWITVNKDKQGLFEVFATTSKAGGCPSQSEATARLISMMLNSGLEVSDIIEHIGGIICRSCVRKPDVNVKSCPDAIAKTLQMAIDATSGDDKKDYASRCKCGAILEFEGGCVVCRQCGESKCG